MRTGKISSGFEYAIEDNNLNNYLLLKDLAAVENGNPGKIVSVTSRLLGEEQEERLIEHVASLNDGNVPVDAMVNSIKEIFEDIRLKNSSSSPA